MTEYNSDGIKYWTFPAATVMMAGQNVQGKLPFDVLFDDGFFFPGFCFLRKGARRKKKLFSGYGEILCKRVVSDLLNICLQIQWLYF